MAEKENRESTHSSHQASGSVGEHLDLDSIIRDILATFVVNKSGVSSNTVSDNLSAASALAKTFSTVVDSEILE